METTPVVSLYSCSEGAFTLHNKSYIHYRISTTMIPLLPSIAVSLMVMLFIFLLLLLLWIASIRYRYVRCRQSQSSSSHKVIAFFHPYCSGGGGGERVLWKMIHVLQKYVQQSQRQLKLSIVIYTLDQPTETYRQDVLQHVRDRFSIDIQQPKSQSKSSARSLLVDFVHLHTYKQFLAPMPYLSLLMESLGTMVVAYHALRQSPVQPTIFCDTTGCAFTYFVARIMFGITHIVAYVHYPTISTDMLQLVWERRRQTYTKQPTRLHNTNSTFRNLVSQLKTMLKLIYYVWFAVLYGMVGSLATLVMVNSSWTRNHISFLWKYATWKRRIHIVYPPCAVKDILQTSSLTAPRQPVVVSIGQFRPEKDHELQIEALACLLKDHPQTKVRLVLIGSCRGKADEERLQALRELTQKLHLQPSVEFVVNQPYSVIQEWLSKASIGIHTMWNEHFGIGVVEMMAAGLLVIAHNSGGPKSDIIIQPAQISAGGTTIETTKDTTGFLAATNDEYAKAIYSALTLDKEREGQIRANAQVSAQRFTDEVFTETFREVIVQANIL